ncbi:hypothetical protein H6G97_50550 [Nostoc flagelliforme FACHB-838]|uniref:Uncharacterized protein n=1 Tax=Nostoc flagelliforme FACHB-838 TaxID=2692904 RepID=A0ABR8E5Q2_9NOSO|nr:hypothetical protein [Nostoc flagelliforme]MBD2537009.1 hypothetical protein [Nostoc flagelliforme FACHB-838]
MIAEAGSSEGVMSELGDSGLCDTEMVAFLRLWGGAASQHLNSFGQYEKGLNVRVQADCLATMGANSGYVFIQNLTEVTNLSSLRSVNQRLEL